MKFILCIFALTAYVSAASISNLAENSFSLLDNSRIVGGHPVTIEQYGYQVSLRRNFFNGQVPFRHFCGGSIYSERIVITAAHCVEKRGPELLQVAAGSTNKNGGIVLPVQEVIAHEGFTRETMENDIAILVLGAPLPLNNLTMKAIELAEDGPFDGEMATVTGWGSIKEDGDESDVLLAVEVPVMSNELCNEDYGGYITDLMFCAGYRGVGERDACQGDSGGPLAVNAKLAGIVSWGEGCGLPDFTGVYTKVSNFHRWILEKVSKINGV